MGSAARHRQPVLRLPLIRPDEDHGVPPDHRPLGLVGENGISPGHQSPLPLEILGLVGPQATVTLHEDDVSEQLVIASGLVDHGAVCRDPGPPGAPHDGLGEVEDPGTIAEHDAGESLVAGDVAVPPAGLGLQGRRCQDERRKKGKPGARRHAGGTPCPDMDREKKGDRATHQPPPPPPERMLPAPTLTWRNSRSERKPIPRIVVPASYMVVRESLQIRSPLGS